MKYPFYIMGNHLPKAIAITILHLNVSLNLVSDIKSMNVMCEIKVNFLDAWKDVQFLDC